MIFNFKIVRVKSDYCDYLRQFDKRIPYNKDKKELRPFVGVLFMVNDLEYFAPLSSPKEKHYKMKNTLDFYKLKNGKLGAINFNNMFPVKEKNYDLIDLNSKCNNLLEEKYQSLLKEQLTWLNEHFNQIQNKSIKLYNLYINNKLPKQIVNRCCNFKLLEEKSLQYND